MNEPSPGRAARPTLPPEVLAPLRRLDASRWVAAGALDWAVIACTFWAAAAIDHPAAYALAIVPLGSRQQGLGALFHDAAHRLVSRDRRVNDALGSLVAAWPLGLTLGGYRRYHLVHHRKLGTIGDPEAGHRRALPQWDLPLRPRQAWHFVSDLVGGGVAHLAAAGQMTRPVRRYETAGFVAFWAVIAAIAWRLHLLWVPALWVASIATTFWSGVRLRIFTEHLGTLGTHRITMPRWFAAIVMPHSIGLHWEHHHFPAVPFHQLPALRAALPLPAPVPLGALVKAFARSPALASGDVAEVVGRPTAGPTSRLAAPAASVPLRLVIHVLGPLALGAAFYFFLRPDPPLAVALRAALGLDDLSGVDRSGVVRDAVPDAAWAYAVTATPLVVWARGPSAARAAWTALAAALAVGWELGQAAGVTPGRFSVADLVTSAAAATLAALILYPRPRIDAPQLAARPRREAP